MKFIRHAYHRKKRLGTSWRRPRGLHNKMRLEKKGSSPRVKEGYRTNKSTRGFKNGLELVWVYNESDVSSVDKKTQGVVLGAVGMKKKLILLKQIKDLNLTLVNGDVDSLIKHYEEKYTTRVESKKQRDEEHKKKEEQLKEVAKKAESQEKKQTPLSEVKGVGPSTIKKLEAAGITSAEQLAESSDETLDAIEGVNAQKVRDAATKTINGQDEQEKVLTKAR